MSRGGSNNRAYSRGFTIVELIIVIVVIAILAAVVVVSFGAWRTNINANVVKSDLRAASSAMEDARIQQNAYSTTLPSSFKPSDNVVLTLTGVTASTFCITGSYSTTPTIQYYIDNTFSTQDPKSGSCATRPIANVPGQVTNVAFSAISSSQIQVQWILANPNYATSYDIECAQDAAFILGKISTKVSSGTASTGIVTGVQPSTLYFCRVKAVNANGQSGWSDAPSGGGTVATSCAEVSLYGTYPDCYSYDSLALGTSISGYWNAPPEGYFIEDGSAVSRTTYSDLFALIGTTYGIGDGFSTFNLPDSRGRATVNINASDTEFNTVGKLYGEKNHTLTQNEMPSHSHGQFVTANSGGSAVRNDWSNDGGSMGYSQGITTNPAGGGVPYSVIQPSIVKQFAIKYRPSTGANSTLAAGTTVQGYWSAMPSTYLYENGLAVSRTSYPALFSTVGTTYGVGNGSTTFNLPDSRGRVGVNLNTGDSYFGTLGQLSGEKQHTLTIAEMVQHTHNQRITALSGGPGTRSDYSSDAAGGTYDQGQQTETAGGGQPHNVIQPSITKRSFVKTSAASGSVQDAGIRPGTSIEGWWSTVPSGYLLENGAAVSRSTYAALFAVIGTTFGAGDGSTTFNLPDSRGRVAVSLNVADTEFNVIGKQFGAKLHTMTLAQLPSHSHGQIVTANSGCCAIRRDFKGDAGGYSIYIQGVDTAGNGGGSAFNKTQPSITKMFAIKF